MKNSSILPLLIFFFSAHLISAQSVGISDNGLNPNASAILDVFSNDKGLLIPRTDTTAVNAAGTPANGLMIYDDSERQFFFYTGSRWNAVNGELIDQDGDTRVEVEKFSDDDNIRFVTQGVQALSIKKQDNGDILFNGGDPVDKNLFFGYNSGINGTTGVQNSAFGYNTLTENTEGTSNIAMGAFTLSNNTEASNNTAIGWSSMQFNTTGDSNSAFGFGALRGNTIGHRNTAIGLNAMNSNVSGFRSTALGYRAGIFDTLSAENVYLGANAGAGGNTTNDRHQKARNTMVGYSSGEQAQGSDNVFLGYESGTNETGDHKLYIENSGGDSTQALIYGEFDNDLIRLNGKVVMRDGWADGDGDTKIELEQSTDEDEISMTIGGDEALSIQHSAGGQIVFDLPDNKRNVYFGQSAGSQNGLDSTFINSGSFNTGVGYFALANNTNGLTNTAYGAFSLSTNTTGSGNTALGNSAMSGNTSGANNVAIGNGALISNSTGFDNVAIGLNAMSNNDNGFYSTAIGRRAGNFVTNSVRNVFVGTNAGSGGPTSSDLHEKENNVMVGYGAGENAKGDGNVFLGHKSGEDETGDNKLYIENSDAGSNDALIYGDFNSDYLRVNGNMGIGLAQTGTPSDALHVRGDGVQNLFRVQLTGDTKMRIYNNGSISLGSNNTGISSGDVYVRNDLGIGVSIPSNRLHVSANLSSSFISKIENLSQSATASGLIVKIGPDANPTSTNVFVDFQEGDAFSVGSITGNGSGNILYNTTSDRRLKQNIQPFISGLELLNKIDAHTYEMKVNPGVKHIGFIAQELYEVLPNIVKGTPETTNKENPMMVDYGKMTPVLVAAVKELVEKNIALEKELANLKNMNNDMVSLKQEMETQRQILETLVGTLNEETVSSVMTKN